VVMLKTLNGMLQSVLWFYTKLKKDIEKIFFVNTYDPCVADRMVNGCQHKKTYHIDDVTSRDVDKKVNNDFSSLVKGHICDIP
jgi:hypothetical protein